MTKNLNRDVREILSQRMNEHRAEVELAYKGTVKYKAKSTTKKVVAGTLIATSLGTSVIPAFADNRLDLSQYRGVGYIGVTEEVGPDGNGGIISTGEGDYGGVSYGLIQLSTTAESIDKFVYEFLPSNGAEFCKFFENAGEPATKSFNEAWTKAYESNPGKFEALQIEFKEKEYVEPGRNKVLDATGIDLYETRAGLEILHSSSVQYGPDGIKNVFVNSGVTKDMSQEEIFTTVCDYKINTVNKHFSKCSDKVKASVKKRFEREKKELLKIVKESEGPSLEDVLDGSVESEESTTFNTEKFTDVAESYFDQGTVYKMGGKNTKTLDCSGYVSLVYQEMGVDVDEMMTNASKFRNDSIEIDRDELEVGDLVFWHDLTGTKHNPVFHIGIYMGDDTVFDCSKDHNGLGTRKLSELQDIKGNRYFSFGRYEALGNTSTSINKNEDADEFSDIIEADEFKDVVSDSDNDIIIEEDSTDSEFEDVVDDMDTDTDTDSDTEDDSVEDEFEDVVDDTDTNVDSDIEDEFEDVVDDTDTEDNVDSDTEDDSIEDEFEDVVDDTDTNTDLDTEDESSDNVDENSTEDTTENNNESESINDDAQDNSNSEDSKDDDNNISDDNDTSKELESDDENKEETQEESNNTETEQEHDSTNNKFNNASKYSESELKIQEIKDNLLNNNMFGKLASLF